SQSPAAGMLVQDPRLALPAVDLASPGESWTPQFDLLDSDRFATDFVVETSNQGRASLRFGDGVYAKAPAAAVQFSASYRVGNGLPGNVGAEALTHLIANINGVTGVRNPLPARGGTSPENPEEVRQYAPQAFRTQERAVTPADYAEVIQRHPQVQKAAATRRWTGSWYTMFISVDFKGGLALTPQLEDELRDFLERFRLAGHDVEIDEPQFVPLDIIMGVCVKPGYFRSQVKQALLETFSRYDLPSGQRGFFHPDQFTFGQPVYLSQIIATAMDVPGVKWVEINPNNGSPHRFQRWGRSPNDEIANGQININRLEIAQLDNDPNQPENGKIEFLMEGGL
ncbi:MAG TPA: putative baseplate assembly protein, partial [Chloroflexi bacterium]|nr:putative baseplate assembly protein [Chloroflexota bacterium]